MKLNINNPAHCEASWPYCVTSFITGKKLSFLLIDPAVKAVEGLIMSGVSRPNKVKRLQYKSKEVSFANCASEKICCCWNPLVNWGYFIQSESHLTAVTCQGCQHCKSSWAERGSSSAWFLLITFIQSFEVKQWLHQERVGVRGLFIRYLWVADHYDYTRQWIT